jgi:hypothetical protein
LHLKRNNMPVKKKPSAAQLAARAKFVKMVRAKAAAKKKAAPKKIAAKKVAGLDKITRKGKKTTVHYSRVSGLDKITRKGKKTSVHYTRIGGIAGTPNFKDPDAAREIQLFAENDGDLYRQQRRPILVNLSIKHKKGNYDIAKAAKLWRYFIDSAMKKYQKDFGSRGGKWSDLLSTSDRQLLAEQFAQETKDEFDLGNYTEK